MSEEPQVIHVLVTCRGPDRPPIERASFQDTDGGRWDLVEIEPAEVLPEKAVEVVWDLRFEPHLRIAD